jgi:hypothetical protein
MGHAGTIISGGEGSAETKIAGDGPSGKTLETFLLPFCGRLIYGSNILIWSLRPSPLWGFTSTT